MGVYAHVCGIHSITNCICSASKQTLTSTVSKDNNALIGTATSVLTATPGSASLYISEDGKETEETPPSGSVSISSTPDYS